MLCNNQQTLGYVILGCKVALNKKRFTWRHNSFLTNLANSIPRDNGMTILADIPGYPSPCIVSGKNFRPDMIIKIKRKLWIVELSVDFETNLMENISKKNIKYNLHYGLVSKLRNTYKKVYYLNLSMGGIGVFYKSEPNLKKLYSDLKCDKDSVSYIISKLMNVCI